MAKKTNGELLAIVRAKDAGTLLDPIWKECFKVGLVGRCWGKIGSTIILGTEKEIVVLSEDPSGQKIELRHYSLDARSTELSERVKIQVKSTGISLEQKE